MIYFCADDYGISASSNARIEECIINGALNKISVLPNGELADFDKHLLNKNVELALHLNLVEGCSLSERKDVDMLVSADGSFRYSFIGLFFKSVFGNRKRFEKQLYNEIKAQIKFWQSKMGENVPILIDSHQHTHMIPLILKTLLKVIREENVLVEYIRIPDEPILPYIKSPSLYFKYSLVNIIKQWLLKFLAAVNKKTLNKANIKSAAFIGILFSGRITTEKITKILPLYKMRNKNIEIAFHPGYLENGESLIDGCRQDFKKFYYSKWRKIENTTLLELKNIERRNKNALS